MITKITIALLLVVLMPTVSASEGVLVIGGGVHSCGKWLELKNDRASRYQFQQWVSGYISGSNYSNPRKQSAPPDIESVMAFVDQYCKNNPLHSVASAAAAVVQETGGPKAEHMWKR